MNNLGRRIFGAIGGALLGTIVWAIIKANYLGGLKLLPISNIFIQLIPGIIIGAIVGFIFFRLFSYIADAFLNISQGD